MSSREQSRDIRTNSQRAPPLIMSFAFASENINGEAELSLLWRENDYTNIRFTDVACSKVLNIRYYVMYQPLRIGILTLQYRYFGKNRPIMSDISQYRAILPITITSFRTLACSNEAWNLRRDQLLLNDGNNSTTTSVFVD